MILEGVQSHRGPLALASKLLGSSVLAQVAVLAATAVVSTSMHPADFAIYGAVSGATGVSASFNTLAAESRTPVVNASIYAKLNRAGMTSLVGINLLTLLAGLACFSWNDTVAWILVLTAGCAFLNGVQQLLTGIILRQERQSILASGRVSQGVANAVLLLVLWLGHAPGFIVLIVSWLLSMLVGDLVLLFRAARGHLTLRPATADDWRTLRTQVGAQPVANLLAASVANLPSLLLPAMGQTLAAGLWALVSRFLNPLVNTTYNTLQPLYYGRAAAMVRDEEYDRFDDFHARWMRWMVLAGIPVAAGCIFISMVLLPLLGPQWRVGWLAAATGAIYYTSQFSCLPMSQTLQMLGRIRLSLRWTIVRCIACGIPLLLIGPLGGQRALFLWSIGAAATFYWQFWLHRDSIHAAHAPQRALDEPSDGSPEAGWGVSCALGVITAAVASIGNSRPALWLDEVATLTSATRSWGELAAMLHHVDLVHAPYYALMHLWVSVAGSSSAMLRLPSALCVGVTVVAIHRVVRRFMDGRTAVLVAVVAACLPRVLWAGTEAREQALAMALATLTTLALLRARHLQGRRHWAAYWAFALLTTLSSLFGVLVLAGHLVWAWLERRRTPLRPTLLAVTAAGVPVLPWTLLVQTQSGQVSWIGARTPADIAKQLVIKQYLYGDDKPSGFEHTHLVLAFIVALMVCHLVLVGRLLLARRTLDDGEASLVGLASCLLLVPLLALLAANVVVPVYVPRYLTWTAPWMAVLLVLGSRRLPGGKFLLAITCAVALFLQLPMRQYVDVPHDDYATAARDAAASQAPSWAYTANWLSGVATADPAAFAGRTDIVSTTSAAASAGLYPSMRTAEQAIASVHGRVFLLVPGSRYSQADVPVWRKALTGHGCTLTSQRPGSTVATEVWQCP